MLVELAPVGVSTRWISCTYSSVGVSFRGTTMHWLGLLFGCITLIGGWQRGSTQLSPDYNVLVVLWAVMYIGRRIVSQEAAA